MPPPENVTEAIDPIELEGLERAAAFGAQGDAYAREHAQRPATIGLLLSTSPMALLIWYIIPIPDVPPQNPSSPAANT